MATNESIENQPSHRANEETNSNEFIGNNDIKELNDGTASEPANCAQIRIKQDIHSSEDPLSFESNTPAELLTKSPQQQQQFHNDNNLTDDETHEQQSLQNNHHPEEQQQQNDTSEVMKSESNNDEQSEKGPDEDDDLEEGELKDDDDDDDDDDDELNLAPGRLPNYNNDANNNDGFKKEPNFSDQRQAHGSHAQNFPSSHHNNSGQGPPHSYHHQPNRRHHSPNSRLQHPPDMHGQFGPNHPFVNNSNNNNNNQRYPPGHDAGIGPLQPLPPHLEHQMHPMAGLPDAMFNRGGPGGVGPMQKVSNVKCRFYSKTNNKCTWGDNCRFEHRDESPGPEFENRLPGPGMNVPGPNRAPPPPPSMGPVERPYQPYAGRHQPYPPHPPPPHGYNPYEPPYGPPHHHSTPPPLPPHSMPPHHWRQQHSPYPPPTSSAHPPESLSPAHLSGAGNSTAPTVPSSGSRGSSTQPPNTGGSAQPTAPPGSMPLATGGGGPSSPNYPSQSAVYDRKHRLAYELAPWNDRGYPPPSSRYDHRGYPGSGASGGYPPPLPNARGVFYRSHYGREPYGRESMPPHLSGSGGPHPYPAGYPPNYPSAYRSGPMGPHASHYKYMSSSHRNVPPDVRRSRSNKRGHDEDESSWSDSGSEDSILGQASYSKNKMSKKQHNQQQAASAQGDNANSEDPLGQGSGTPPGEPLTEDRERQEMLLNKLKEIEDLMAKKKGEQEDPM